MCALMFSPLRILRVPCFDNFLAQLVAIHQYPPLPSP
jgi:hypothetical protein